MISGRTGLHYSAKMGNEKVSDLLINYGTNVNAKDKNGQTPLHIAAKNGKQKIANVLIASGANADIVDDTGKAPLHWAAKAGLQIKLVKDLMCFSIFSFLHR